MAVTRMLQSFTGLPVILTERKLSHELGYRPDKLTASEDHGTRWERERALIEASLSGKPMLIGLPAHSLLHTDALGWLAARTRLVYLRENPASAIDRIVQQSGSDPHKHWLLTRGEPFDVGRLRSHLSAAGRTLEQCPEVLDIAGQEAHRIAWNLLEPLGLA